MKIFFISNAPQERVTGPGAAGPAPSDGAGGGIRPVQFRSMHPFSIGYLPAPLAEWALDPPQQPVLFHNDILPQHSIKLC